MATRKGTRKGSRKASGWAKMPRFVRRGYAKIREINERYAAPTIKMSPMVRSSLLVLRLYLIVLIGLTLYKFITLVR